MPISSFHLQKTLVVVKEDAQGCFMHGIIMFKKNKPNLITVMKWTVLLSSFVFNNRHKFTGISKGDSSYGQNINQNRQKMKKARTRHCKVIQSVWINSFVIS